jgi:hypothetical protein
MSSVEMPLRQHQAFRAAAAVAPGEQFERAPGG